MFKDSILEFSEYYGMADDDHEEALMRAFQRWRKRMREEHNPLAGRAK